ncbi:nuclear transport factor 2 family protein [Pedobacter sp.]|uniref:nuclear transport factor 2 family protein n=1 Tax=Pedobacter sp. TaxID=1411316 RepID=UPI00396CF06B
MRALFKLVLVCGIIVNIKTYAQTQNEENNVKATINLLFDGMRNRDTTMIRNAFAERSIMQTISRGEAKTEKIDDFIKSIAKPFPEKFDERITFDKILIDANLASVWTSYKFYIGEKFSHCGVNSFQLLKTDKGWKIIYIIDTRRKDNCN